MVAAHDDVYKLCPKYEKDNKNLEKFKGDLAKLSDKELQGVINLMKEYIIKPKKSTFLDKLINACKGITG
jgi:hypothetical protein